MAPPRATGREQPSLTDPDAVALQKRAAAKAAADEVLDGMNVGLGTGSTVAHLLSELAGRGLRNVRYVATSPATEQAARSLGLTVLALDDVAGLDLAVDGADQIDPAGWLIKGGGAAHTREKIIAAAARRFVVIASADKAVQALSPPVPLELLSFGVFTTLAELGDARLREVPPSPDGGLIADYLGPIDDPRRLAARLAETPGVVEHGLFAPELVSEILIARPEGVERRAGARPAA
jgi:ribose 5-phosphate isomerase A